MKTKTKPLSIYIHIPFCEGRCDYCDFTSFDDCVSQIPAYLCALENEIREYGARCTGHEVRTIFIGGGTPSLLSCAQIRKLMTTVRKNFKVREDAEITIEVNPASVNIRKLNAYLDEGINRISIGVQSIDDITLRTLGRKQSVQQAHDAIFSAWIEGFRNISVDIIYGVPLPREIAESNLRRNISGELEVLLSSPWITHVSAYALTVCDNTPIAKRLDYEELYELTEELCIEEELDMLEALKEYGYKRYEVSNFAKTGFECKHNQNYWTAEGEYLGLGLGASGLFNEERYENTTDLSMYLLNPNKIAKSDKRTVQDCVNELIMLGLRTKQGLNLKSLERLGVDILVDKAKEIIELKQWKLIRVTKDAIKPTRDGVFVLNAIIEQLIYENDEICLSSS